MKYSPKGHKTTIKSNYDVCIYYQHSRKCTSAELALTPLNNICCGTLGLRVSITGRSYVTLLSNLLQRSNQIKVETESIRCLNLELAYTYINCFWVELSRAEKYIQSFKILTLQLSQSIYMYNCCHKPILSSYITGVLSENTLGVFIHNLLKLWWASFYWSGIRTNCTHRKTKWKNIIPVKKGSCALMVAISVNIDIPLLSTTTAY